MAVKSPPEMIPLSAGCRRRSPESPEMGLAAVASHMASSINFNQFLEKEKLKSNGSNFTDWFRHVRIFLNGGNLQYVLDAPLGDPPAETETDEVKNVYATRKTRVVVNKTTSFKKQGKSKGKNKKSGKKAATPPVKPKTGPKPDAECYYCKEKGHWKRNCSKYLADLKSGLVKKKKEGMEHWTAVKNILKYLKRTKDMFLCYGGDQELVVTSYTDASWNTDPDDSKSQSGYVFILNGASKLGKLEAVHGGEILNRIGVHSGFRGFIEAVWMKRFIVELGVVPSALDPLVIYCDNMGAIANAQEPRSHKRLKHIKLRYHSIREYIEDGEVKICKVHTDLNVADPLTKALPRAKHDQHQNAMGVRYLTM
ncbi:hypothetical protein QYE76_009846 [Lolium multiflorum]|uniref:CCHC-type domain-containing protein n=1 Tax=Lolium multiflorum TaxID=4521 RepID=A0AAD8TVT4_LOLMU|nr:hypothetical protein QYE76_009846 [Lolium multiflorum]